MTSEDQISNFLSSYNDEVKTNALKLRKLLLANLPNVTEQVDLPAKMIAYCYSQKYVDLICVIIPSKKGLKLGFNRGTQLPDPEGLLKGTGKMSRYVEIHLKEDLNSVYLKTLVLSALELYKRIK